MKRPEFIVSTYTTGEIFLNFMRLNSPMVPACAPIRVGTTRIEI